MLDKHLKLNTSNFFPQAVTIILQYIETDSYSFQDLSDEISNEKQGFVTESSQLFQKSYC